MKPILDMLEQGYLILAINYVDRGYFTNEEFDQALEEYHRRNTTWVERFISVLLGS